MKFPCFLEYVKREAMKVTFLAKYVKVDISRLRVTGDDISGVPVG